MSHVGLVVDTCLRQLPDLLSMSARNVANPNGPFVSTVETTPGRIGQTASRP